MEEGDDSSVDDVAEETIFDATPELEVSSSSSSSDDEEIEEDVNKREENQIIEEKILYIIKPEDRITSRYMTLKELARVIGIRADQVDNGAPLYIESKSTSVIQMAAEEIIAGRCPLKIRRYLKDTPREAYCEEWSLHEMLLPADYTKK